MDLFFQELQSDDLAFWFELTPLNQSAFLPYSSTPTSEISASNSGNGSNSTNMNKRMIDFMRRNWPVRVGSQESESARCYRRKISERMRREKEKNGYLALHAVLPLGTKNDKNSIVQMAAKRILELKQYKEVLERRNHELEVKAIKVGNVPRSIKIKFKVGNSTSGVDYMVEVLKCLNSFGSKITSIKSRFSDQEVAAVMDIETERTLEDVERNLRSHFSGRLQQT
ncbi:transcription factor bHLH92-like isoform X2 [Hevea brasiliensis]|uniref:transcription factor bHLH92-like isoform X2 n=1 Tax=Hevea brasiliensis TaxID=3981 RepID=UPI0025DB6287|nr:transcription factor bHLH92-like isoform X2 [Hevea brasiliensis]